ncbi:MAG: di-trans,poly-cis-decaprenylcistransferase [Helicobacter sp.]|nr:di-trans,poly-cis-decaprenylcistransferase [Helicobacter sp.]
MNQLLHLAIIMDGNRRWAKAQNLSAYKGYQAGADAVREVTIFCAKKSVKYLTLYAFSTENWKRKKSEVDFLMRLLSRYLKSERETYLRHNIRFKAIGDISFFSNSLKDSIRDLEQITAQNEALTQVLALNYGSRDEISRAFLKMLPSDASKTPAQITEQITKSLDTCFMPEVDLLIRTGGEQRLSNFLLWQSSYAELAFSKSLWPDFSTQELGELIDSFQLKDRRFGI